MLKCIRTNKSYGNASKCIFGAEEILFLGCSIGKRVAGADPAKIKAIVDWPIPENKNTCVSGLALSITYTNTVKNTLIWLGH